MQQKVSEAKLEQSNLLLKEAEVKHKREKEYVSVMETVDIYFNVPHTAAFVFLIRFGRMY